MVKGLTAKPGKNDRFKYASPLYFTASHKQCKLQKHLSMIQSMEQRIFMKHKQGEPLKRKAQETINCKNNAISKYFCCLNVS
jgi:hypothetical protein